jgi:hypothetical protein
MVREAVMRHLAAGDAAEPAGVVDPPANVAFHPSHVRLALVSGDGDGACLIEPAVRCNHCGYCQSYGH